MKKVLIIGSGIAGLASALRMRKKGYEVTVFEGNDYAGGKMHAFEKQGFRFDMGPSLFTMPHLVDELFELFGLNPYEYFTYTRKTTICNYFWEDGTQFSAKEGFDEFVREASSTFDESPQAISKYLRKNREKYDLTVDVFLKKSLHKLSTYFSIGTLKSFLQIYKLDIFRNLSQVNEHYFKNPHLIQLFNRYATYNGSSPYKTPGIMSMIPHLEMDGGTYYPKGGIHQISQSLFRLAQDQGVEFHFNEPVKEILHRNSYVYGLSTSNAEYQADLVISNADVYATYHHLLPGFPPTERTIQQERSSSALIFYWGIKETFEQLDLHNILFSDQYHREFEAIFDKRSVDDDPTVYINITSKEDPADAPKNCENWFVMVNTPGNFGQDWDQLKSEIRKNVIKKINRILGTDLEKLIIMEEILDPVSIEANTSSFRGSLYGTSSNSKFAAFLRHPNFSNRLKNLYFCGGSAHPGGGIPLCLLSAKITTDLIH